MSRKGVKNKSTLIREQRIMEAAEKERAVAKSKNDPVLLMDSVDIMQEAMRYFYRLYSQAVAAAKPKAATIRAHVVDMVMVAEKVAPYQRHRLATVKLDHDPNAKSNISDQSAAELRAGIMADMAELGLVPPPTGIANRTAKGNQTSH